MKAPLLSQQPVISIIIPTYNCVDTFNAALQSVLDQDLAAKEIIVVDGGSTDGTLDLLKKYDDKIDNWISEPDTGIYNALNKGIDLATGEWLYFLGADDRLHDSHVLADIPFHHTQSKMIYGNVVFENDGARGLSGSIYDGQFNKYKLAKRNICHQAIFYNKELFVELGKYDEKYPIVADWAFNIKAFASKKTYPTFINRIIAIYANKGLSDKERDINFQHDKTSFIKTYLGLRVYFFLTFPERKAFRYASRLLRRFLGKGDSIK